MSRSFGLVDSKVMESEYFLERITNKNSNFFSVQCDTVAFAASARSITFAMQASLKDIDGFSAWYAAKQAMLRQNQLARFFHEFRRISQHVGDNTMAGGSYRDNTCLYYFGAIPEIDQVPEVDVATACISYFKMVLDLVFDCYIEFNPLINGQWCYTSQNYKKLGMTIEDAMASLGYPADWIRASQLSEEDCWRLLRREADGCNIQPQFERWLSKRVPHPDDEL